MSNLARRDFLRSLGAASAVSLAPAWAKGARGAVPAAMPFKLGAISDGLSPDFEEALKILRGFHLDWVEVRNVFGKYNTEISPEQIKEIRKLTDDYGIDVSVVDTALFKCALPGTKPVGNPKDIYPYTKQMEMLKRATERAYAWGTDRLRGFAFWRVADPGAIVERVADELDKAADAVYHDGMRLMIED